MNIKPTYIDFDRVPGFEPMGKRKTATFCVTALFGHPTEKDYDTYPYHGCGSGWLVFDCSDPDNPKALEFIYDAEVPYALPRHQKLGQDKDESILAFRVMASCWEFCFGKHSHVIALGDLQKTHAASEFCEFCGSRMGQKPEDVAKSERVAGVCVGCEEQKPITKEEEAEILRLKQLAAEAQLQTTILEDTQ